VDFHLIIKSAWADYDKSKTIRDIEDISAMVSTNHVYRITFDDEDIIIAKLSFFGKFEHFKEDHRIIQSLSNNLLYPFENLLSKSLLKNNRVYVYRYKHGKDDAWVVFYNPTRILDRLPRRLNDDQIKKLGSQLGKFHKACSRIKNVLPKSSKTLRTDIYDLQRQLEKDEHKFGSRMQVDLLKYHCEQFLKNRSRYNMSSFEIIPVFIDWNIGNFSVTPDLDLVFPLGLRLVQNELSPVRLLLF
jgi:Ser/Thr protein kinase RdoA (MazF antagonist)